LNSSKRHDIGIHSGSSGALSGVHFTRSGHPRRIQIHRNAQVAVSNLVSRTPLAAARSPVNPMHLAARQGSGPPGVAAPDEPGDPSPWERRSRDKSTTLSTGHITPSGDMINVESIEPDRVPPVVRVTWPTAPTIATPSRFNAVAAEAMKILAYASTRNAQIRAQRRC
jgi:hypothetical protein